MRLLACAVLCLAGCGGDEPADVTPSNAWPLHGNGDALVGKVPLSLSGRFEPTMGAVAFDGVTGFASTDGPGPATTTGSFSVSAWVSLDDASAHATTAVSQLGDVAGAFYLGYAEGTWGFAMTSADTNRAGSTVRAESAPVDPDPRAWVHLVGTYDGARHELRVYVDGQRATPVGFTAKWQARGPLTVGRAQAHAAPTDFWPGAIADVSIYPVALDDAQVRKLHGDSRPASPPPPKPSPPPGFHCPPEGGACLGPLKASAHTTRIFSPAITYTVPDGWTNEEDLLGNFLLRPHGDPRYVGIYRNVAAPRRDCVELPDPQVGRSVAALTNWLTRHPGLQTTKPHPVSVGGLKGVYLDVSLSPSWTETCSFTGALPAVPFLIGGDPSSLTHVIQQFSRERLYLLGYEDGNVAIEISPESGSLPEFLEQATPIVESLRFGK